MSYLDWISKSANVSLDGLHGATRHLKYYFHVLFQNGNRRHGISSFLNKFFSSNYKYLAEKRK